MRPQNIGPDGPAEVSVTRYAIYTRVSTGEQAREGYSLDEQERRGLDHINHEGGAHVRTYTDAGVSGTHASRPELDRLLAAADAGEFDALVCYSLDRLGRSTKNLLELYERLERAGVSLVFLRERLDTSTPVGRLLRTLLSAIAEFERELIIGRVTDGIGGRARTGKPWGEPAYGFARGDDGHWTANPAERSIVERIFDLYISSGLTYNGIAALLTPDGVPTRRGSKWTATVVKRILSHPAAVGQYVHKGEVYDGKHDGIVSESLWAAARARADRGSKYAPRGAGRLPKRHLFVRGHLRCGGCGDPLDGPAMLPRSSSDSEDVYVCRTDKLDSTACPVPPISRAAVDSAALSLFERVALDVEATRDALAASRDEQITVVQAQADRASREIAELTSQLARVERDYLADELGGAAYTRLLTRIEPELEAAQAEHERLTRKAEEVRDAALALDVEGEALRRLAELRAGVAGRVNAAAGTGDIDALRASIGAVFERFVIRPAWDPLSQVEAYGDRGLDEPVAVFGAWAPVAGGDFYLEPHLSREIISNWDGGGDKERVPEGVPLRLAINQTTSGVPEYPAVEVEESRPAIVAEDKRSCGPGSPATGFAV